MSEIVINVTKVEEVVTINATPNVTQILVNTNSATGIQSVVAGTNITIDNTDPSNPIISAIGGGGGAVDSVNGQTGVVILDADDISDSSTSNKFVTSAEKTAITHSNRSILDAITESFTTTLKSAYDNAVTWITTNGTNILNHLSNTSNPHNVTKSQVGLSNVPNTDTTTTANITDSTNKRFVTDANLTTIGNTSGSNTGDNATNTTSNAYADAKVASELASFKTANFLDFTSSGQTQLNGKVDKTNWIDISLTSTIVGFSAFTIRDIKYKFIDANLIYVRGDLQGASNGLTLSFTIPFTSANDVQNAGISYIINNGIIQSQIGLALCQPNTNIVGIFRDAVGPSFSGSGVKRGTFSLLIRL